MKELLNIFGLRIYLFGVMIAIGILAGLFVVRLEAKRKNLDVNKLFDIALFSVISAVIGARLFYILFYNLSFYLKNPADILKITEGGLSIHGGLLGAFIFAFFYVRKHKISFFKYADAIAPGIILGQGIGRIGCDVFGKVMTAPLPWGVMVQGQLLHPAQVYEFLLDYLVFFILWRKRKQIKYDGQLFLWYVILFAINRGVVELFRENPSIIGWFSVSHLLSLVFIAGAAVIMLILKKKNSGFIKNADLPIIEKTDGVLWDIMITLGLMIASIVVFYWVHS